MSATTVPPAAYAEATELLNESSFLAVDGLYHEGESVTVQVISVAAQNGRNLTVLIEPHAPRARVTRPASGELRDALQDLSSETSLPGLQAALESRLAYLNSESVPDDLFHDTAITLYDDAGHELGTEKLDDELRALFVGVPTGVRCELKLHEDVSHPEEEPPIVIRFPKLSFLRRFLALRSFLATAAVCLIAFLMGATTLQLRPQWMQWLTDAFAPLQNAIRFDDREPLKSSGNKVWTSGVAKSQIFQRVEMEIDPSLPDGTEGTFEKTLGKDSSDTGSAPFRLDFEAPADGKRRKVTIRFVPHPDVVDALEKLSNEDSLLKSLLETDNTVKKTTNIACTVYGVIVGVPDNAPPLVDDNWTIDGSTARFTLTPQTSHGFVTVAMRNGKGGFISGSVQTVHAADDGSIQPVEVEIGVGATGTYKVIPVAAVNVDSVDEFRKFLREGNTEGFLFGGQFSVKVDPDYPAGLGRSEAATDAQLTLPNEVDSHIVNVSYSLDSALLESRDVWLAVIPADASDTIWLQPDKLDAPKDDRVVHLGFAKVPATGKYWVVLVTFPKETVTQAGAVPLTAARKLGLKAIRVVSIHRRN